MQALIDAAGLTSVSTSLRALIATAGLTNDERL